MSTLSPHGERQIERLAMHVGLMAVLIQRPTPLPLVQAQCVSLRQMLREVIDLDQEPGDAQVCVSRLLPAEVAEALAECIECPDDLSGLDDGEVL